MGKIDLTFGGDADLHTACMRGARRALGPNAEELAADKAAAEQAAEPAPHEWTPEEKAKLDAAIKAQVEAQFPERK